MNSILVRVDNRLVHGQILEAWVPYFRADCIVVLNDDVAGDVFRESVIRMVVPSEIEVQVHGVEEFAEHFNPGEWSGRRTIVLIRDIRDALRAFRKGFSFSRINIGNVHNDDGKCCVTASIFLDELDVKALNELVESGVTVELRCIPQDNPIGFSDAAAKISL